MGLSVVMAYDPAQPLAPRNHTGGGFFNAFERTISEPVVTTLMVIVLHVSPDRAPSREGVQNAPRRSGMTWLSPP